MASKPTPARLLCCLAAWLATAAPLSAADSPAPVGIARIQPELRLHGQGTLHFWGLNVYQARLWTRPDFAPLQYQNQALALELQYARSLDGAAMAQRAIAEMRRVGSFDEQRANNWLTAMVQAFPSVHSGDRITGFYLANGTTQFQHNDKPTVLIADPEFGRLFFGIWLDPKTSEPALRRSLLGLGS